MHHPVFNIGPIGDNEVTRNPMPILQSAFVNLGLALQCAGQKRLNGIKTLGAHHVSDVFAAQGFRRLAIPGKVRMVGKPIAQLCVPIRDHGRHVVEDGAHIVFGRHQTRSHLLAQKQLAHKKHGQPHAGHHQQQRKTAQAPRAAVPLVENAVTGLCHIEDERVLAHLAKGIKPLCAIQRRLPYKRTVHLALKTQKIGRITDGFSHVRVAVREPRNDDSIGPKKIDPAVGAQINRAKQLVEKAQAQRAHHHACEAAIGMAVHAR